MSGDKNPVPPEKKEVSRRDLIKSAAVVGGGSLLAAGAVVFSRLSPDPETPVGKQTIKEIPEPVSFPVEEDSDLLVRMQRDLRRALKKPVEERHWIMVIDVRKCVGCHACTVACIAENKLPPGVVYRPVVQEEMGAYPNLQIRFFPRPCMQCSNPPCVSVCPVRATWKRPDGVTIIDYDRCIGCRYCLQACPYGARTSDFGHFYTENTPRKQPYEELSCHEYGKSWNRSGHNPPMGNARKCHFCLHRVHEAALPQCVTTCIGRANYFGDANDPGSLVAERAGQHNRVILLEGMNTKPNVFYLI